MNDSDYQKLLETGWRRKLTVEEETRLQAYFADHPTAPAAWDAEMNLNQLLVQLPDAPLATNFAAQVLQAVARENRMAQSSFALRGWHWLASLRWAQQTALAALVLGVGLLSYQQYEISARVKMAQMVATVSHAAELPGVPALQDFDAIHRLRQVPSPGWVDAELLAVLQ